MFIKPIVAIRYRNINSESLVSDKEATCYHLDMDNREIRFRNLKYAVSFFGSARMLAEAADCSEKYIKQILQGFQGDRDKNPRKLGDSIAAKIASALGKQPYWMDQVHEDLWDVENGCGVSKGFTPLLNKKHLVTIARYDTGGAMGDGVVLHDEAGVIESWEVSKTWVTANLRNYTSAENLCIVTGFGDSMRPTYNPGDPLIVDKGVKTVEFDSVYFFRIDNHGYVKRLQRIPTTSGLLLRALSDNKDTYDAFDITSDMNFQVLGRVVQVWRREDF